MAGGGGGRSAIGRSHCCFLHHFYCHLNPGCSTSSRSSAGSCGALLPLLLPSQEVEAHPSFPHCPHLLQPSTAAGGGPPLRPSLDRLLFLLLSAGTRRGRGAANQAPPRTHPAQGMKTLGRSFRSGSMNVASAPWAPSESTRPSALSALKQAESGAGAGSSRPAAGRCSLAAPYWIVENGNGAADAGSPTPRPRCRSAAGQSANPSPPCLRGRDALLRIAWGSVSNPLPPPSRPGTPAGLLLVLLALALALHWRWLRCLLTPAKSCPGSGWKRARSLPSCTPRTLSNTPLASPCRRAPRRPPRISA